MQRNLDLLSGGDYLREAIESGEPYPLRSLRKAMELGGCRPLIRSKDTEETDRTGLLLLDVAWVEREGLGYAGTQMYCCDDARWYEEALGEFFIQGRSSLLAYKSVHDTRHLFHHQIWECEEGLAFDHQGTEVVRVKPFDPGDVERGPWTDRFNAYAEAVKKRVPLVQGKKYALLWIYAGAGIEEGEELPDWAASVFVVCEVTKDRTVEMLLSNFYGMLAREAPTAFEKKRAHVNLGQALTHEFKNWIQDVAVTVRLLIKQRAKAVFGSADLFVALERQVLLLESLCVIAYALFTPSRHNFRTMVHGEQAVKIFWHGVALVIKLMASTKPHWDVSGIRETEGELIEFFRGMGSKAATIEDLCRQQVIAYVAFFAYEPLRNLRSRAREEKKIALFVEREHRGVSLVHECWEKDKPRDSIKSESVKLLMRQIRQIGGGELVEVAPNVDVEATFDTDRLMWKVKRRTRFTVHSVCDV